MRKLDWYILKKLLVTFVFCLLIFTVVAVAVDSSEKADDFVKAKLNTMGVIKNYYIGFVPWIWSLLFPL
ncbi:MAG TPA: LptF/LptG family permease, partial [Chitinophagaceae bacterium]|nr:LptF/LptG family permease [Chitinophagaceae bacterium]